MKTIAEILGGAQVLILKSDPNLCLLCGFDTIPDESTFSRVFSYLAEEEIWNPAMDVLVQKMHEGKVVYHVNRDSTMDCTPVGIQS